METTKTLGQVGYDAYAETAGGKTFDGRPMPTWEQLGETPTGQETRRRWEVSADAIRAADVSTRDLMLALIRRLEAERVNHPGGRGITERDLIPADGREVIAALERLL